MWQGPLASCCRFVGTIIRERGRSIFATCDIKRPERCFHLSGLLIRYPDLTIMAVSKIRAARRHTRGMPHVAERALAFPLTSPGLEWMDRLWR